MIGRRHFLKAGLAAGAGLLVLPRLGLSRILTASTQTPLAGRSIPQFVNPLPSLDVLSAGVSPIELRMMEFDAQVLPTGFPPSRVWGYLQPGQTSRSSYLGPVIIAQRGVPTEIKWVNNLGITTNSRVPAWVDSTDQTLHWADPLNAEANTCAESVEPATPPDDVCAQHYSGPIPAVVHLHGGEVPPALDGGPDAWFTSDGTYKGHAFYSKDGASATNYAIYRYPNVQESAPLWFHDHTLGLTRLNVYAGLAGVYLIADPGNPPPANLPLPIPLGIQDRMFDTDGQLYFPAGVPFIPNPSHPFWVPEFIGDTIVVNGKTWPYLNVEPKRYRFLFLNGSNARGYEMFLVNQVTKAQGPPIWQIGTDGGYLDAPVKIDPNAPKGQLQRLVMLPGERADVIIDFAGLAPGATLLLRNIAKAPYPGGEPPAGNTTGRIMQFRVVPLISQDTSYDPAAGVPLRAPMVRLVDPATGTLAAGVTAQKIRQLTLNEVIGAASTVEGVTYPGGPLEILVNNTEQPGTDRPDFTPISVGGITAYYSELPHEGETEVWEIVNLTADAHPIHLHLVQFQLMNRQAFDAHKYEAAYAAAFPGGVYIPGFGPPLAYDTGNPRALGGNPDITAFLRGPVRPPAANEAGWKDTVIMLPGEVTRIAVRWAPTDLAVTTVPADASYPFDPDGGHGYVWHCHIIDHEDNEMMRPTSVQANFATRSYVQGADY
jgi:FtsP/CotA-like multicopper oxidase with cupredoxin domain